MIDLRDFYPDTVKNSNKWSLNTLIDRLNSTSDYK